MANCVDEKSPSSRGFFGRIAGAIRKFSFASWPAYRTPEFGRMSLREFLARGEAFLEEQKIDPDAWVMNRAIIDAIIEHDPSVDLDKSLIVLEDTSNWVDLGKVPRPWATEPTIDVIGTRPYSIASSLYPTGIHIRPLHPDATDPKARYGKVIEDIHYHAECTDADGGFSREKTLEATRELLAAFDMTSGGSESDEALRRET
jgi:hypothetical protein